MTLPSRTTVEDIQILCNYFAKKPTGASIADAKSAVGKKTVAPRKINALKYWGLLEDTSDGKLKATDDCRLIAKDDGRGRKAALAKILRSFPPYLAIIERVVHRKEISLTTSDIGAHWHDYFKGWWSQSK